LDAPNGGVFVSNGHNEIYEQIEVFPAAGGNYDLYIEGEDSCDSNVCLVAKALRQVIEAIRKGNPTSGCKMLSALP
jgi:hypothetical protein